MGWVGLGWQGRHDSGAGPYSYACCSDNNDKGKVCQTAPLVGMPHLQLLHPTRPQDICYGCVRAKDSGNYRVWGCFFGEVLCRWGWVRLGATDRVRPFYA